MQPAVVVFDFDGTLVHGDSVAGFALGYLLGRPLRLVCMLPFLPLCLVLLLGRTTLSAGVSLFWWLLSFGTPARTLAAALVRYVDTELATRGNAATLAAFASHVARGDRVLVATAAPPLLVRRFLRAKGLTAVGVVGTRLRRRWGGLVACPHCLGQTKVVELERRHGLSEWAEVYSDSALDLPIMLRAAAVTLVAPSARGRARIEGALAKGVSLRVL